MTTITKATEGRAEIEQLLGSFEEISQEEIGRVLDLYDEAVYQACVANASARAMERLVQDELGQEAYMNLIKPITKYGERYMQEIKRYESGEFGEYPTLFGEDPDYVDVEFQPRECCGRCQSAGQPGEA